MNLESIIYDMIKILRKKKENSLPTPIQNIELGRPNTTYFYFALKRLYFLQLRSGIFELLTILNRSSGFNKYLSN